ncbi:hypothetical protein [Flavobacterium sp. SM2513]|uniref:hypothetical protein n=1 Tax=Flavobacterium sp. SM2513 TaxID=3424766 RepID=UPI003D7F3385
MLPNKIFLLFLLFSTCLFSQEVKTDTIYVYEEVIVHDTVYIEKPIIKIDKAVFISENKKKHQLKLSQNGVTINVPIDTLVLITNKKIVGIEKRKSWFFGGKVHLGVADNSLFKEMNAPVTTGLGLGVWTQKKLFNSNFSIGIGLDVFYWMSTFSVDAKETDGKLNGYYFTADHEPKLFKGMDSKHFQLQVPVQLYYTINRLTPSIGWFVSTSSYKTQFLGSSSTLPLKFDETQTFRAEALQIGYLMELQYALSEHVSVGVQFSFGQTHHLVFTNTDANEESFKSEHAFSERRGLLQLVYKL